MPILIMTVAMIIFLRIHDIWGLFLTLDHLSINTYGDLGIPRIPPHDDGSKNPEFWPVAKAADVPNPRPMQCSLPGNDMMGVSEPHELMHDRYKTWQNHARSQLHPACILALFPRWGYAKMVCNGNPIYKWMTLGYPYWETSSNMYIYIYT